MGFGNQQSPNPILQQETAFNCVSPLSVILNCKDCNCISFRSLCSGILPPKLNRRRLPQSLPHRPFQPREFHYEVVSRLKMVNFRLCESELCVSQFNAGEHTVVVSQI